MNLFFSSLILLRFAAAATCLVFARFFPVDGTKVHNIRETAATMCAQAYVLRRLFFRGMHVSQGHLRQGRFGRAIVLAYIKLCLCVRVYYVLLRHFGFASVTFTYSCRG